MKLMVYQPNETWITSNNIPLPQALEFADGCSELRDQAQSKQRHTNLAALLWVPLVWMDSHVPEVLVRGYFSTNSLSPRAQHWKKRHLASQHKEDKDVLERVQQWAAVMIQGLKQLPYQGRLGEAGLFSTKTRRLERDVIREYKKLGGTVKKKQRQ